MGLKDKQFFFSPLPPEARDRLFATAVEKKSLLIAWEKGQNIRENFTVTAYRPDFQKMAVELKEGNSSLLAHKKVCFHLDIEGTQYLGEGEFVPGSKATIFYLKTGDTTLYKWERRQNFRLPVFPHLDAYLYLRPQEMLQKGEKSLDRDDAKVDELLVMGYLRFRIKDISTSGLAFFTEGLKLLWPKGHIFEKVVISFEENRFVIPRAELVYSKEGSKPEDSITALHFLSLSAELERVLFMKIGEGIRKMDILRVFEDFIK